MSRSVYIYIEGGAPGSVSDANFRRGWQQFLVELRALSRQHGFKPFKVVRSGSRSDAFRRFRRHVANHPGDLCVLLVDSEGPVPPGMSVWQVVKAREGDSWVRPAGARETDLYLMVQMVETWLLTDADALAKYFGPGFNRAALPTTNLEARSKDEIDRALRNATRATKKGHYRHGQAHEILELVRPERVKDLTHGKRLFVELAKRIVE